MAIDSEPALKTAIADWLNKTSLANVEARASDFIALAEAEMTRDLDTREMVGVATYTISDATMSLPHDFAGVRAISLIGSPNRPLEYARPEDFDGSCGTGRPERYTVTDQIIFDPAPDADYEIRVRYRKRLPALSNTRRDNWLLRKHPDAYLYGALSQALAYFRDDERVMITRRYKEALHTIAEDDKRTAYPSTLNATGRQF